MLTNEQKEILDERANDFLSDDDGFTSVYEKYLQKAVELAEINADNVEEADKYFRNKIKDFLGGNGNG